MTDRPRDDEAPATPDPSEPDEPQTSLHAQTVGPEPATSDAPAEPAERTLAEESVRGRHGGGDEG